MGFLRRKKKTTVETKTTTYIQSKIVKLSYLQTLAIEGGINNVNDFAKETNPDSNSENQSSSNLSRIDRLANNLKKNRNIIGLSLALPITSVPVVASLARSLFGKKTTQSTETTVQDSGWSIIKTWNQPQFDIIRYAIGIKELSIAQFLYEPVSEFISKPWLSPKELTKISLTVDQFIPSEFNPGKTYIEYYIKPDTEDSKWTRINPLGSPTVFNNDNTIVPRIINFNTERPVNSRLEEMYVFTEQPVKSVRFRVVFRRPEVLEKNQVGAESYTPILRSYKLLLFPKGGL